MGLIVRFLVIGVFALTHPKIGTAGHDFIMCFLFSSQAGQPATHHPAAVLLDSSALMLAAGAIAGLFMLLPPRVPRQAADAAARIRRDLQRILETGVRPDPSHWRAHATRQILRLSLHLGRAEGLGRCWPEGLLATLNLSQAADLFTFDLPALAQGPAGRPAPSPG